MLLLAMLALADPTYTVRLSATVVSPPDHGWLLLDTTDTAYRCDLTHHDDRIVAVCPLDAP